MKGRLPMQGRFVALGFAALVLAGCGSTSSGPDSEEYRLSDEISFLTFPSPPTGGLTIQATDFTRVGELIGEPKPDADSSTEDLLDWFQQVGSAALTDPSFPAALLPSAFGWDMYLTNLDVIDAGLGYSLRDVDRFTEVASPPYVSLVAQGSFDSDAVTSALGEPDDGVWSFGYGVETHFDLRDISPPLGQGISIGRVDGRTVLTRVPEQIRSIDSPELTVASDEHLAAVARGLDSRGQWYSAMLFSGPPSAGNLQIEIYLRRFESVGVALNQEDGKNVAYLAYSHETPELAQANEERLAALVKEMEFLPGHFGFGGGVTLTDTTLDGTLLTAELSLDDEIHPISLWRAMVSYHPLFTYGP